MAIFVGIGGETQWVSEHRLTGYDAQVGVDHMYLKSIYSQIESIFEFIKTKALSMFLIIHKH